MHRQRLLFATAISAVLLAGCGSRQSQATSTPSGAAPASTRPDKALPETEKVSTTATGADGRSVSFEPIYFDYDSDTLLPESRGRLQEIAAHLESHGDLVLTIEGHCDERGTTEYNIALGDRRARAAKEYLVRLGIDPSRIHTVSYGKERPAVSGTGEEAWARNRRGEFVPGTR